MIHLHLIDSSCSLIEVFTIPPMKIFLVEKFCSVDHHYWKLVDIYSCLIHISHCVYDEYNDLQKQLK